MNIDNFFLKRKSVRSFSSKKIDKETIQDFILSDEYYIQDPSEIKKEFTPLYYKTYINTVYQELTIKDIRNEYNFKLYFNYDEEIARGRVAIIRTIGMKIEDKKIASNVTKPFNAVLVPSSIREDSFLKSLENESHTELSFDHIKNQDLQKNAKRFINNISKELAKIIETAIRKNNPADGLMDTKDILYIVENQFKKDLANTVDTVKINRGDKKATIVTVPPTPRKDPKPGGRGGGQGGKKKKLRKVEGKKAPESGYSDKGKNIRFNAHPDIVKRLILGDKEIVRFDFSENKNFKNIKSCDISLAVVDGMGKEYANEFIMDDNYEYVTDKINGNQCKIDNNIIRDVETKDNIAEIQLDLKRESNKALKFVYYVEV